MLHEPPVHQALLVAGEVAFNSFSVASDRSAESSGAEAEVPFNSFSVASETGCAAASRIGRRLSILSQLLRPVAAPGGGVGGVPFNSFSVASLPLSHLSAMGTTVLPFNSFSVASEGFVSWLLISLSLSREKFAKQPRTVHSRMRSF